MARRQREPSFCYKLDEARRTKRWPVQATFDKDKVRSAFERCGVEYPRPVKSVSGCAALNREDLAGGVVVKPTVGHSGRGVMALAAEGEKWRELITGGLHTLADVRSHLESERARWDLPDRWGIEELLLAPDGRLPNDVKVYAFRGRIGCVLVRSGDTPHRYRWFTPDLEPTRVGKSWYVIDDTLAAPAARTVTAAARVSSLLPVPFMRVDVYETTRGTVFGELTPYPASYEWFTDTWDLRLGTLYEEAETELIAAPGDPQAVDGSILG